MKVIYVSSLVSQSKMNDIIRKSKKKPLQSIQKFHRLICEGLVANNIEVKTISSIPMSRTISNRIIWFDKKQNVNGVEYNYIPFFNLKIIRQISTFICTIFMTIKECIKEKKEKVFICDLLNTTLSSTVLILSKLLKFKCIAIVTDLPRDIGGKFSISKKINQVLQNKYDAYILLTEAMNNVVNKKNKPFIIIEGIADTNMKYKKNNSEDKYREKVCIYAGGLYEKYGVKDLVKAFKQLKQDNIRLHIYGTGELEDYLNKINDNRIKYFGVVENEKIVEEEMKATLLINPRFSREEYTKYSFPSKNMEYMSTGTPVLTTKLPGIPEEYYQYIYCIDDESVDGIKNALTNVLNRPIEELQKKGEEAKKFVLENKNNMIQTEKIIEFLRRKITNEKI